MAESILNLQRSAVQCLQLSTHPEALLQLLKLGQAVATASICNFTLSPLSLGTADGTQSSRNRGNSAAEVQSAWKHLMLQLELLKQQVQEARDLLGALPVMFYWNCFPVWGQALLAVVADESVSVASLPEAQGLLEDSFAAAPAPLQLEVLVGHLSQVVPSQAHGLGLPCVTAMGSDTAARLLSKLIHEHEGVHQLLLYAAAAAATGTPGMDGKAVQHVAQHAAISSTPDNQSIGNSSAVTAGHLQPNHAIGVDSTSHTTSAFRHALHLPPADQEVGWHVFCDAEHVCSLLLSIPDRSAPVSAANDLQHDVFYSRLLHTLVNACLRPQQSMQAALQTLAKHTGRNTCLSSACLDDLHGSIRGADILPSTGANTCHGSESFVANGQLQGSPAIPNTAATILLSEAATAWLLPYYHHAALELTGLLQERLGIRGWPHLVAHQLLLLALPSECQLAGSTTDPHHANHRSLQSASCTATPPRCYTDALRHFVSVLAASPSALERVLQAVLRQLSVGMPVPAVEGLTALQSAAAGDDGSAAGTVSGSSQSTDKADGLTCAKGVSNISRRQEQFSPAAKLTEAVLTLRQLLPSEFCQLPEVQYMLANKLMTQAHMSAPAIQLLATFLCTRRRSYSSAGVSTAESSVSNAVPTGSAGSRSGSASGTSAQATATDNNEQASRKDTETQNAQAAGSDEAVELAARLARVWADRLTLTRAPVSSQAQLTTALLCLLAHVHPQQLQGHGDLLGVLLQGVSARLSSPTAPVRMQGMRVGRAFSRLLDPASQLFEDQGDLLLTAEEVWPGALNDVSPHVLKRPAVSIPQQQVSGKSSGQLPTPDQPSTTRSMEDDAGSVKTATDSDDELAGTDDDDGLQPYDLREDPDAEKWQHAPPADMQLRALAAQLRKQDEPNTVMQALKRAVFLIRAAPPELAACAPELLRALLHCRVPEWLEVEAGAPQPQELRLAALLGLLATAPLQAGDALLAEVYSPHLDMYQRLLLLDGLAAAATELSAPGSQLQLEVCPAGVPRLVEPAASASHSHHRQLPAGSLQLESHQQGAAEHDAQGQRGPKTRVWGHVSLRRQQGVRPSPAVSRSHFAPVAMRWATGLLREVHQSRPFLDLLGRDSLMLGRLLATLATFCECSAATPAALPLAAAVLELLQAPEVHAHAEPYVRRATLLAAGQVLAALPPARVAAALLEPSGSDSHLVSALHWLGDWAQQVALADIDHVCQSMSQAVINLQASLASRSLAGLQEALPGGHTGGTPLATLQAPVLLSAAATGQQSRAARLSLIRDVSMLSL